METSRRNIPAGVTPALNPGLTGGSRLERSFDKFEAEVIRKLQFQPAGAWSEKERGEEATRKRILQAKADHWYFDHTYFPPETFRQGYAPPGVLHRSIHEHWNAGGIHWWGAPRDCAKTVNELKMLIGGCLLGEDNIVGIMCEDLRKARLLIGAIEYVITTNPRIVEDFKVNIRISNDDMMQFTSSENPRPIVIMPFSLERNPRGNMVGLERLDRLLFDDVETTASSFEDYAVEDRIDKLVEAYKSLRQGGTMIGCGNNLHPNCALNKLLKEQKRGVGRDHIHIHDFRAFARPEDNLPYVGSVWKEMFPGPTEKDVRLQMKVTSDEEWSQLQNDPKKKGGRIFPREFFKTYKPHELPADARGPGWCDQNLSLKNKGDFTTHGRFLFSPSTMNFYGYRMRCLSYNDPNKLLDDYFAGFDSKTTRLGMDGNVAQESVWLNYIWNWCRIRKRPPPPVEFKRYTADHHIAIAQLAWYEGRVYFPEEFIESEEGQRFKEQITDFLGKSAGKKDDAPDWLICVTKFGYDTEDYVAGSGDIKEDFNVAVVKHPFRY